MGQFSGQGEPEIDPNTKLGDRIIVNQQEAIAVDFPGCVQKAERMHREERDYFLEEGKRYAIKAA